MTLIPLEQFLGSLERAAAENRRAFEERAAKRKATAAALEEDVERLTKERRKKMRLREQMFAEGVSVRGIDTAVAKIDADLNAARADMAQLPGAGELAPPFEHEYPSRSVRSLGNWLAQHGCESAFSFPNAEALYAHLPFSFDQIDDDGRLGAIRIDLGSDAIVLKVDVGDRFVLGHWPRSLSWVPFAKEQAPERSGSSRLMAVVLGAPAAWFITGDTKSDFRFDFSNLVLSLRDHVTVEVKAAEPLRLSGEPASVFATQFRRRILEATLAAPHHPRTSERQTSLAIAKRIAPYWSKFIDAPWHRGIAGPLALLKHLVENRETPRFWIEEYEGHYGFRVRTRDHDWLLGDIFIAEKAPHDDDLIRVESKYAPVVATIGAMHIRVDRSKE